MSHYVEFEVQGDTADELEVAAEEALTKYFVDRPFHYTIHTDCDELRADDRSVVHRLWKGHVVAHDAAKCAGKSCAD